MEGGRGWKLEFRYLLPNYVDRRVKKVGDCQILNLRPGCITSHLLSVEVRHAEHGRTSTPEAFHLLFDVIPHSHLYLKLFPCKLPTYHWNYLRLHTSYEPSCLLSLLPPDVPPLTPAASISIPVIPLSRILRFACSSPRRPPTDHDERPKKKTLHSCLWLCISAAIATSVPPTRS